MDIILPVTLTVAGAAAILNIWLGWRVGQVRTSEKVLTGDGGNQRVICRMRAHANYTEYTPFILVLMALIELARGPALWLWLVGGVYLLARIAHAFGMDANYPAKTRMIGTVVTMLTLLGLGIYAITIPYFGFSPSVTNVAMG